LASIPSSSSSSSSPSFTIFFVAFVDVGEMSLGDVTGFVPRSFGEVRGVVVGVDEADEEELATGVYTSRE
jgi:hypothetical protein